LIPSSRFFFSSSPRELSLYYLCPTQPIPRFCAPFLSSVCYTLPIPLSFPFPPSLPPPPSPSTTTTAGPSPPPSHPISFHASVHVSRPAHLPSLALFSSLRVAGDGVRRGSGAAVSALDLVRRRVCMRSRVRSGLVLFFDPWFVVCGVCGVWDGREVGLDWIGRGSCVCMYGWEFVV